MWPGFGRPKREQWGAKIGEHEAVALKLSYIARRTFAMERSPGYVLPWPTTTSATSAWKPPLPNISPPKSPRSSSMKLCRSEGESGYESASSLAKTRVDLAGRTRLRDSRINRIIEGTSEIMHLFIAREALDPHLSR